MTLKGVFIDSFSQQPWNRADQHQQKVFQQETKKLWDFAEEQKLFAFKTVEDVLKENQELKDENEKLNNLISDDIADIKKQLNTEITERKNVDTQQANSIKNQEDMLKEQGASLDEVKVKNNVQDASLSKQDAKNKDQDTIIAQHDTEVNQQKAKNQAQDA